MAKKVDIGETVAGRYLIEGELGEGGAGYVMRATDTTTGGKVALKFLLDGGKTNDEMIERFRREASSASRITSEHAIRIHEVQTLDDGQHYMVMELLDGQDLDQLIVERKRLEIDEAVDLVLQACEALAEAHSIGIIHRDLKPANLFVTRRDGRAHVKVLDFGISKVKDSSAKLTRTASVMGSPEFMPPEQLQGAKFVDARSDLWALGVILYEATTGSLPFPGNNIGMLTFQIVTAEPDPPNKHRADIPPGLAAVILRCLEKKTAARWQSVAELADALAFFGTPTARESVAVIKRWQPIAPVYSNSPSTQPASPLGPPAPKGVPMIGVGTAPTTLQSVLSAEAADRILSSLAAPAPPSPLSGSSVVSASGSAAAASVAPPAMRGAVTPSGAGAPYAPHPLEASRLPGDREPANQAGVNRSPVVSSGTSSGMPSRILIALGALIVIAIVVLVVVVATKKPKAHSERNEFDPDPNPSPTFSPSTYV